MTDPDNSDKTRPSLNSLGMGFADESAPRQSSYKPGDIIGDSYQLISLIGTGGMGEVYRARHLILGQYYALKILLVEGSGATKMGEKHRRRFELEGRTLAKLRHKNIVGITNMGVDNGRPYCVMELLEGRSLADLICASGPLSPEAALPLFIEVAAGLGYAHKQGIIHRDVKPSNIMLSRTGSATVARLVDFGLARMVAAGADKSLTATGEFAGSPFYMSPEQCAGVPVDHRSDIYSLGCSLFEALTGSPPFKGRNAVETLLMHQGDVPPKLTAVKHAAGDSANGINKIAGQFVPGLERAVAKMLNKNPRDRYQSMEQLEHDLERILAGKDILVKSAAPAGSARGDDVARLKSSGLKLQFIIAVAAVTLVLVGVLALMGHFLKPPQKVGASRMTVGQKSYSGVIGDYLDTLKNFSTTEIVEHKKFRCFHFPRDVSVGFCSYDSLPPRQAMGEVLVPFGHPISLQLNRWFLGGERFAQHFAVDDVRELRLTTEKLVELCAVISKWTKLDTLILVDSEWSPEQLASLDQVPQLRTLGFEAAPVDFSVVCRLRLFNRLEELRLNTTADLAASLAVLSRFHCPPRLRIINPARIPTEAVLLPQLHGLKELWFVGKDHFDDSTVAIFSQMHQLKFLHLRRRNWSDAAVQKLLRLPYCRFDAPESDASDSFDG